MRDTRLASMVADMIAVEAMLPWACPSTFEPDPRYELLEVIGATPSSLVYLARDHALSDDQHVAQVVIKISRGTPLGSREALMGRRVTHPNVVRILGRGDIEDSSYVIMEYIDGGTLDGLDPPPPLPPHEAVRLVEQVAFGIQALHAAGVSHLDLKPSNVLMDGQGHPKVSDFGLASDTKDPARPGSAGTLAFMAPEQFRGEPGAPPADVYALGGLLFFLLTGRLPNGSDRGQAEHRLSTGEAVDCSGIHGPLRAVCEKALSVLPEGRHPSAAHFAEELGRWRRHLPVASASPGPVRRFGLYARRHPAVIAFAATVLLLISGGIGLLWRNQVLELQAEKQAHEMAAAELEIIKAKGREVVRRVAVMTQVIPTSSPTDTVLPVLIWLEWLTSKSVISGMGEVDLAEQRVPALQNMLLQFELLQRPDSIAAGLTRLALSQSLLELDAYESIPPVIDDLKAHWPGEPSEKDAFWQSAEAIREVSLMFLAIDQAGTGATPAQLARLDEIIESLRTQPDAQTTYNLIKAARERQLGKPATPVSGV